MSRPQKKPHVLLPELVPSDLWGRSAYRMLGNRVAWTKRIRPDALANARNRCELCGSNGQRLICHDKWVYDDKKTTATLAGFEIHCGNCDLVTHVGRMMQVGDPEAVLTAAVIQLRNVNKCKTLEAISILKEACLLWEKRDKKKWKIRVAPELLESYPELEGLARFTPAVPYQPQGEITQEAEILRFVSTGNPTQVADAAWIEAKCSRKMKKATGRTGKWLFFVAERYIDDTWRNVRAAVEAGNLWKMAKVSTVWQSKGTTYVICVYTYDHEDAEDVMVIREKLRSMGFNRVTSYKTDEQTAAEVYSDNIDGKAKYKA